MATAIETPTNMLNADNLQIRPPLPGELGWLVQVHTEFYAREFGWLEVFECLVAEIVVDYLKSDFRDRQACFIAEVAGTPVGSVMLTRNSQDEGKLRVLFVTEEARGRGVANKLIAALLEKARDFGYSSVMLLTTNNQLVAREIYRKFGFSLASTSPNTTFAPGSTDELWRLHL